MVTIFENLEEEIFNVTREVMLDLIPIYRRRLHKSAS